MIVPLIKFDFEANTLIGEPTIIIKCNQALAVEGAYLQV